MVLVRQQYVIYQVEIFVVEGIAKFDPPITLNGLKTIHRQDGWVPLDIISGPIADESGELPDDNLPENETANGRGRLPTQRKPKKNEDDDEKEDHRSSHSRAKLRLRHHQFNTLKQLEKQHVYARLRVSSFERRETIMEIDKSFNVDIYAEDEESDE